MCNVNYQIMRSTVINSEPFSNTWSLVSKSRDTCNISNLLLGPREAVQCAVPAIGAEVAIEDEELSQMEDVVVTPQQLQFSSIQDNPGINLYSLKLIDIKLSVMEILTAPFPSTSIYISFTFFTPGQQRTVTFISHSFILLNFRKTFF